MCAALFSPTVLRIHFLARWIDETQSPHSVCFVPRAWGDIPSMNRPGPGATQHECCFPGLTQEKRDSYA